MGTSRAYGEESSKHDFPYVDDTAAGYGEDAYSYPSKTSLFRGVFFATEHLDKLLVEGYDELFENHSLDLLVDDDFSEYDTVAFHHH